MTSGHLMTRPPFPHDVSVFPAYPQNVVPFWLYPPRPRAPMNPPTFKQMARKFQAKKARGGKSHFHLKRCKKLFFIFFLSSQQQKVVVQGNRLLTP